MKLIKTALLAVALGFALAAPARAQIDAFTVTELTPSDTSIAASATETTTTDALTVRGDHGIGFVVKFKLAGAGTENMVFKFDVSADGTNWTTNQPFTSGNIAANGTTSVIAYFNFSPTDSTELRNIRYIRLASVTNGNASYALTVEKLWSTKFNR